MEEIFMKIDPRIIDLLKKEEAQKALWKVGVEVLPDVVKGIPSFAKGSASKVKNTIILGKDKVNEGYEALNHEKLFYKKIKDKVIPFPSNYTRVDLKDFLSQSSIYLKQKNIKPEKKTIQKKFDEYHTLHSLLDETIQNKDYEEYIKIYIGKIEGNYFIESETLKNDFISVKHDYRKVISFLYNVIDGKKSEMDIMKELSKEKPVTNI